MANVVITGSTLCIGLAMAKEFLKYRCNVTISGRPDSIAYQEQGAVKVP
ncbi:MAG: hypothetical protein JW997_07810 [Actinobacteria bacterium]|nr:hypothetical protein [Actinomycetota bacterium]